jgi:histidinol-phosphate aminotransferase
MSHNDIVMTIPIRPNVRLMEPYSPGKPISEVKRELGLDRVIKLASNENPFGPSPKAVEAVRCAATQMHLYPDGAAYDLRQALTAKFGVPASNLLVGNGSDELIHLLGLVLLGAEGDELVIGDPSFVRYDAAAQLAPCKLTKVPLDSTYTHDLVAMQKAITEKTKLVIIGNPNNPTGTIVTRKDLDAFIADLPASTVVILDEAYYEFSAQNPQYPSSIEYVMRGQNVVGLRTFSKAYGLAGIRVGYGFAPDEIVDAVNRAREPFDVNSLAQVAGVAALQDDVFVAQTVTNNLKGVDRISAALKELGTQPVPTCANFIFVHLGRPGKPVFQELLKRGLIVRATDEMGQPNCLRISIGTEEENEILISALREVLAR